MPISRSAKTSQVRVGITFGDPAGVGPEVVVRALERLRCLPSVSFLVFAKASVLNDLARRCRLRVRFQDITDLSDWKKMDQTIACYFREALPADWTRGHSQKKLTQLSVSSIRLANGLAMDKKIDAIVTPPIHKAGLKKAGFKVPGHTEYLAQLSRTKKFEMMLVGGPLRVVLVTRHTPIKKVSRLITKERVRDTILITERELKRSFGIRYPRIAVCGLNPHAGEEGTIGNEEISAIAPGIRLAQKISGSKISGPLSPDALFYDAYQGKYDAVVCMYHDQGLIPLKMISRGHGVNTTLGLPYVRTSPDHGTAYDIAGRLVADSGSMEEAIRLAVTLSRNRRKNA